MLITVIKPTLRRPDDGTLWCPRGGTRCILEPVCDNIIRSILVISRRWLIPCFARLAPITRQTRLAPETSCAMCRVQPSASFLGSDEIRNHVCGFAKATDFGLHCSFENRFLGNH